MSLQKAKITFLPSILNVSKYETILFEDAINDIKSDKYKSQIDKLRVLDKSNYTLQKKKLSAYVFSGTFFEKGTATNDNAKSLSGLMICDVDHIDNLIEVKELLSNLPFVACCFISPSGDGLKFCVHADIDDVKNYSRYYTNLQKYFKDDYDIIIDVGKDFRRLCFVSHDSGIYINYNATKLTIDIAESEKPKNQQTKSKQTLDELKDKMLNWITAVGRHECINKYIYMKIRDGANASQVILDTQGFMSITPESQRDEHWQAYYNDINRQVNSAIDKFTNDKHADCSQLDGLKIGYGKEIRYPHPPGEIGDLVSCIYKMQRYQNMEVAHVTAFGLLAGICGRKFEIEDGGLNMYLSVIMRTGMGKDSIRKNINRILCTCSDLGKGEAFIGGSVHTGAKALIEDLRNKRSQICVFTEAGMMMQSQSGDKSSLTRAILSIYQQNGINDQTGAELFSSTKDHIKSVKSPALSIIHESTPETILSELHSSKSVENGSLTRQSLYRYDGDYPEENRNLMQSVGIKHKNKLNSLINLCYPIQNSDDFGRISFDWFDLEDDRWENSRNITKLKNSLPKGSVEQDMATRLQQKMFKYAGLASLYNNKKIYALDSYPDKLAIGHREWEWAKEIVMYEYSKTMQFFKGSSFIDPLEDLMRGIVFDVFIKLRNNHYQNIQQRLTADEIRLSIFPIKKIRQCLRNCKELKYNEYIYSSLHGLDNVLSYMEELGHIRIERKPESAKGARAKNDYRFGGNDYVVLEKDFIDEMLK